MSVTATFGATTVRKARAAAYRAGHHMGRLAEGDTTALATCQHYGCGWVLEITGRNAWRLMWLSEEPKPPGGHCPGVRADR